MWKTVKFMILEIISVTTGTQTHKRVGTTIHDLLMNFKGNM